MYPDLAGQALQSTICGSPRRFAPNMLHWLLSVNRWLMLSLLTLATVPLVCRFTRREVQIEDALSSPEDALSSPEDTLSSPEDALSSPEDALSSSSDSDVEV